MVPQMMRRQRLRWFCPSASRSSVNATIRWPGYPRVAQACRRFWSKCRFSAELGTCEFRGRSGALVRPCSVRSDASTAGPAVCIGPLYCTAGCLFRSMICTWSARKSARLTSSQVCILLQKQNGRPKFVAPSDQNIACWRQKLWVRNALLLRCSPCRPRHAKTSRQHRASVLFASSDDGAGAVHIAAFVSKRLMPYVKNVEKASVMTGFNGAVANKGCSAISFTLGATSYLFCSAHLEAHAQNVNARNEGWKKIESELCKKLSKCRAKPKATMASECFDRVVFMGDLNYRVAEEYEVVCEAIARKDLAYLLGLDQLHQVPSK